MYETDPFTVYSCLIDASRFLHAAAILLRFSPHGMKARSQSIDPMYNITLFYTCLGPLEARLYVPIFSNFNMLP